MRESLSHIERWRVLTGPMASSPVHGRNGLFMIQVKKQNSGAVVESVLHVKDVYALVVIATDVKGWDHVSVSLRNRCPTWEEMCCIKDLFFAPEEAVVQIHPPASQYRNMHPFCLHLWRPQNHDIILPDPDLVAPAEYAKERR